MILNRRKLLSDRARLGRWSERRCEQFLKNKGLRTLTRNYSCKLGELDLVMVDPDGAIVFVEVRSRTDEEFSPPEATITAGKRERLTHAVHYFLAAHKIENRPLRFDIITLVLGRRGRPQIRHYENAFVP
jgi:putative endonuclease